MEKFSSFTRVIGRIPESEKEQIVQEKIDRFNDQYFEELVGKEKDKTLEELKIISLANLATNELCEKYGVDNLNILAKNVHIIKKNDWPKGRSAFYNPSLQGIATCDEPVKINFLKKIFHEMVHFKSYNSMQITTGDSPELESYRVGLTIVKRKGDGIYFTNLNEAVTEQITKNSLAVMLEDPIFAQEIKQTKEIITSAPQAITASGEMLFDENTIYAGIKQKETITHARELSIIQKPVAEIITSVFSYESERKFLDKLLNKIFERNPLKFQNKDEVFEVFARGMMTGNILPVGRLIENTFGVGVLRKIGELDENEKAQERFINSL
ncbi:MAG: hypothetical protein ACOYMB_03685 [Patescibacteria group bacterium]